MTSDWKRFGKKALDRREMGLVSGRRYESSQYLKGNYQRERYHSTMAFFGDFFFQC